MRLAFSILDMAARLLFALGVGCLLLGAYLSWQTLDFARDALRATGEVVGYHETRDGDDTRYRPRVRFTTAGGDIITFGGLLSAASKRFRVGQLVRVVYMLSKPTEGRFSLFT
jgi:hypothetical protein